ncbi:MAG: hypothetical protein CSA26_03845 [Desulfobacterales bacterium]|nr:MAG: hypothetical protein CSA26_03845 [Desulfobacterales bacterium]
MDNKDSIQNWYTYKNGYYGYIMKKVILLFHFLGYKIRRIWAQFFIYLTNKYPVSSDPVFSVVIPIYDRTDIVRQAIESILNQSYKNFELLLILDGSPEATVEVVNDYKKNRHVRIFRLKKNSGNACKGRNVGIRKARGRYIAFLDSDDIAVPERLEQSLFYFLQYRVDLVGGAYKCIVEENTASDVPNGQIGFGGNTCTYEALLKQNMLGTCTIAVKKEWLITYGGFREEMRYREDHELWLRLARFGCRFHNSPEILAYYRVHADNAEQTYLSEDDHWFMMARKMHQQPYHWSRYQVSNDQLCSPTMAE